MKSHEIVELKQMVGNVEVRINSIEEKLNTINRVSSDMDEIRKTLGVIKSKLQAFSDIRLKSTQFAHPRGGKSL